jgi:acetyl esterase/lipase
MTCSGADDLIGLIETPAHSALLTPHHFPSHEGMPPTFIQAAGMDPWRDGGIIYIEELDKMDIPTRLNVYPGLPHVWWGVFPMLKASRQRFEDLHRGVAWLLEIGRGGQQQKPLQEPRAVL